MPSVESVLDWSLEDVPTFSRAILRGALCLHSIDFPSGEPASSPKPPILKMHSSAASWLPPDGAMHVTSRLPVANPYTRGLSLSLARLGEAAAEPEIERPALDAASSAGSLVHGPRACSTDGTVGDEGAAALPPALRALVSAHHHDLHALFVQW